MKSRSMFHLVALFVMLFSLLGSAAAVTPVSANLPTGLTATDWKQIQALLSPTQQAYLKASNTGAVDTFGYSIAISGDTLVVGAAGEASNATGVNGNEADNSASQSGAVYVFTRSGSTWSQQAYLKASNTGGGDRFGNAVSISGDILVVGAANEDSNATGVNGNGADNSAPESGAAYVFTRSGSTWSQQAYLKASNTGVGDSFGSSVAISGDTIVVGATSESSNATGVNGNQVDDSAPYSGAAYAFTRSGSTWSQQAYLKASNTGASDFFGFSVAISGDTLVVGAYGESSNATGVNGNEADNSAAGSGATYVFIRSGSIWSQQAYLKASNIGVFDFFGYSVAISGDTIMVGATSEDSNATEVNGNEADNSAAASGAAYVFTRSGSTWSQQAYLKASNTGASDDFGHSVAISGDTLVVGATSEDSNATGMNGNEADNSATSSGAAYVFTRSGSTWSQQAYLKASNTGASDNFGYSVAISGDTLVVGAPSEASNATGVNGNGANNSASNSGAAYAFVIPHNVTFNANGGSGMMSDQAASSPTALTTNAFTRTGYSFSGWNTASDGSGTAYANGAIYDFSADITLYAQWTALPNHTVIFNANGGTGSMSPQVNNLPAALNANAFTRSGYSFSGWNTAANGTGTAYANGATYDFSSDVTLYAQWTVLTATFADVPLDYWSWKYIESIYDAGITGGCSTNPLNYCPTASVTRAQMAVFLLKGIHGSSFAPPAVNGSTGFNDVATDYWAAAWIKQLAAEGITGGCGNGNYCPDATVTRDQMAVFLLKAKYGSSYAPPAITDTGFTDVPTDYWAAAWIKQLAAQAITGGCGGGLYCPSNPVTRDQMAVFLQKTFNLPLP